MSFIFCHSQRGRTLVRNAKRGVRIPQARSIPRGTDSSRYLRREEMSPKIYTEAGRLAQISPRAAYPSSCATFTLENHAFSRVFYIFYFFRLGSAVLLRYDVAVPQLFYNAFHRLHLLLAQHNTTEESKSPALF